MRVVHIKGADDAARADFATALIGALSSRGQTVSVLGRVAPDMMFDRPGKDSHKHRAAGARDVAVISAARYAVIHEAKAAEPEASMTTLLARLRPVDLVLAIGFDEPQGDALVLHDGAVEFSAGRRFARDDLTSLADCLADAS
ncbi:MAG: hypothetical protein EXQ98_03895 [Alphaproteobacteria bacterium]|nr:hypothetical protein [Alphaproteobacteria bacterium]